MRKYNLTVFNSIILILSNFGVPFSLAFFGEVVVLSRIFVGIELIV